MSVACRRLRLCREPGGWDRRCVKDDLVVLPQALEETQGPSLAVTVQPCNFRQGSLPVDGTKQPVLEGVDREDEISERMLPVDQHPDGPTGQTFPNAHRPWQSDGNVVPPAFAGE